MCQEIAIKMFRKIFSKGLALSLLSCAPMSPQSNSQVAVIPTTKIPIDASKYQFQLFKYTPSGWVDVKKIHKTEQRVTLFLHGFEKGKRSTNFTISPYEVSRRLGLVNLSNCNQPIRTPPPQMLQHNDVYALAWNSSAGSPWELEQVMGGSFDFRRVAANPETYQAALGQDPFDRPENVPLFNLMESYYKKITLDSNLNQINFAGFSKGGHLALKLAQIHFKLNGGRGQLKNIYLLDPYVGPAVLNGGLGRDLIKIVRDLKDKVRIVNIETSDVALVGDKDFYAQLRKEVGQLTVRRNSLDQKAAATIEHLHKFGPLRDLYFDHFRAPQYLFGSTLICDSMLPTLEHPGRQVSSSNIHAIETPEAISEWIYSGVIRPSQCPRFVDHP